MTDPTNETVLVKVMRTAQRYIDAKDALFGALSEQSSEYLWERYEHAKKEWEFLMEPLRNEVTEIVLMCWEDGPRITHGGREVGSTCVLDDGHDGPHDFAPDSEIGIALRSPEREYYDRQARDGYRDGVLSAFEDALSALSLKLPATVYADAWSRWGDVRDLLAERDHE